MYCRFDPPWELPVPPTDFHIRIEGGTEVAFPVRLKGNALAVRRPDLVELKFRVRRESSRDTSGELQFTGIIRPTSSADTEQKSPERRPVGPYKRIGPWSDYTGWAGRMNADRGWRRRNPRAVTKWGLAVRTEAGRVTYLLGNGRRAYDPSPGGAAGSAAERTRQPVMMKSANWMVTHLIVGERVDAASYLVEARRARHRQRN